MWWLFITLAFIVFLIMMNGRNRGCSRGTVDAILSVPLLINFVAIFGTMGWKYGLLSILGSFVFGAIFVKG